MNLNDERCLGIDASDLSEPDSVERRTSGRIRTIYRAARILTESNKGLCLIHNLSNGGAMISTGLALSLNENVRLAITEGVFARGRIAWRRGRNVGMRFLTPIDSRALLRESIKDHAAGKSRAPRLALRKSVKLDTVRGVLDVTMHDISQRGMKINYFGELFVSQSVIATLEGGLKLRGVVRWLELGMAGIQFSEMLSIDQLGSIERL